MTGPHALPGDYDRDPDRLVANVRATAGFSRAGDVHPVVAAQLAALGSRLVLDLGGGTGTLANALRKFGIRIVGIGRAPHLEQAPRTVVRTDLRALPVGDGLVDAAACLWALYHLQRPEQAAGHAHRYHQARARLGPPPVQQRARPPHDVTRTPRAPGARP